MSIKPPTFLKLLKHELLNPNKKIQVPKSSNNELKESFSFPKLLLPLVTNLEALRVGTTVAACIEEGEILSNITYESAEKALGLVVASSAVEELIESNSCDGIGINKADIALFLKLNPEYLSEEALWSVSKELTGNKFKVIQKAPDHAVLIKLANEKQKANINYTLTDEDRKAATINQFHPTVFELLGRFITERLQKEIEESPKALGILRAENEALKLYESANQRAEAIFKAIQSLPLSSLGLNPSYKINTWTDFNPRPDNIYKARTNNSAPNRIESSYYIFPSTLIERFFRKFKIESPLTFGLVEHENPARKESTDQAAKTINSYWESHVEPNLAGILPSKYSEKIDLLFRKIFDELTPREEKIQVPQFQGEETRLKASQAVTEEKQREIDAFRVKFKPEDYERLEQAFKQQDPKDIPRGFALTQEDLKQLISSPNNDSSFSVSIENAYEQIRAALDQNNTKLNILEKQAAVKRVAESVATSGILPKSSKPIAFIKPGYTLTDKSTMRLKTFTITTNQDGKYELQDAFTEAAVKTITDQIGFLSGTKTSQKRKNMPPKQKQAVLENIRKIFSGEA